MTPFSQLNYQRPDVPAVLETYRQLIARAKAQCFGLAAGVHTLNSDRHCIRLLYRTRRGRLCALPFCT